VRSVSPRPDSGWRGLCHPDQQPTLADAGQARSAPGRGRSGDRAGFGLAAGDWRPCEGCRSLLPSSAFSLQLHW